MRWLRPALAMATFVIGIVVMVGGLLGMLVGVLVSLAQLRDAPAAPTLLALLLALVEGVAPGLIATLIGLLFMRASRALDDGTGPVKDYRPKARKPPVAAGR